MSSRFPSDRGQPPADSLLRGFWLALDFVQAFDIVLADGIRRTVTRPADRSPSTDDEELFWGVLGGNAGSFGIVTNYRFECIRDASHPNSYGYAATRKYEKARFAKLMSEVQKWTQKVVAGTLPPGIELMMTVESAGRSPLPVLLVELVHSNLGGMDEPVDGDREFDSIIQAATVGASSWELLLTERGQRSLSALSDSFVRRWPAATLDGRESRPPLASDGLRLHRARPTLSRITRAQGCSSSRGASDSPRGPTHPSSREA